jgi:putative membrane protein
MLAVALMLPTFSVYAETVRKGESISDAEIAHIVVTANQVDIKNGQVAKEKASNEDVKAYAHRMISDHTDVNKEAENLVKKLNVTPKDNEISKTLKSDGEKNIDKLKDMSGKEFDQAYIDAEVKLHKQVIDVADTKLVPSVQNEELKALLQKVRPSLVSHLEHAQKIQESLR